MTQSSHHRSIIYHLISVASWDALIHKGEVYYAPMSLQSEGFIHASTDTQWRATWQRYFSEANPNEWYLLHIDTGHPRFVSSQLIYENTTNGTEHFPHIYGALPIETVVAVERVADKL